MSALRSFGFGATSAEGKIQSGIDAMMDQMTTAQEHSSGEGIELKELITSTAANFICNILYDQHYDPDDPELHNLVHMIRGMFKYDFFYLTLVGTLPLWVSKLVMPGLCRDLPGRVDKLRQFVIGKIKEHEPQHIPGQPRDFIDMYLDERGTQNINYVQFADNCLAFLPDAIDSLSYSVMWMILCVIKHPHVQRKIQDDIDNVIGKDRKPQLADKAHLPYLEAVIMETLRFATPAPLAAPHTVQADVQLRGYTIPKGTTIMASLYAAHHDPQLFLQPYTFSPERFISPEGDLIKNDQIIPFGIGGS